MAKRKIKYNGKDNNAKIFGAISNRLIKLAPEYEMSVSDTILAYIEDLENGDREGYEKKIEKVSVHGLNQEGTTRLINYLKKICKAEKKKEERDQRTEKHQEARQTIETAKKMEKEKKDEEARKTEASRREVRVENVWAKVCEGAEKYLKINDDPFLDKSDLQPKIWIEIKERIDEVLRKIVNQDRIPNYIREEITKRVDDEICYQEIKYFTYDFSFLAGLPEAGRLSPYGRKFIKFDSDLYKKVCDKYIELRNTIPVKQEEQVIKNMLRREKTDNVTKRMLASRLEVIERKRYESEHGNIGYMAR